MRAYLQRTSESDCETVFNQVIMALTDTTKRRIELLNKFEKEGGFKPVHAFEFEGVIFQGEYIDSLKMYADSNESRPFYIWLHDTHTILSPCKNRKT